MKKSFKNVLVQLISTAAVLTASSMAFANGEGIEFSVEWDNAESLYRVYFRPNATPTSGNVLTFGSQVTIKVPHGEDEALFTVSDLTSHVSGTTWSASSVVRSPSVSPNFDYVSFTNNVMADDNFAYGWIESTPVEILSFSNSGNCLGGVEVVDHQTDPFLQQSGNLNVGNTIEVSGFNGSIQDQEVYIGNYGTVAYCGQNNAPSAVDDQATVIAGALVSIDVLANDSDPDLDDLSIASFAQGTNGSVTQTGGGLIYSPNPNFDGTDSFDYTIEDERGEQASATVTIEVMPIVSTDPDTDGDGLTDSQEGQLGTSANLQDSDGDGIHDGYEVGSDVNAPLNTDGDNLIDALDSDDDNDGVATADESADPNGDGSPADASDTDNDGNPDYLDADAIGGGGLPPTTPPSNVPGLVGWLQLFMAIGLAIFALNHLNRRVRLRK